MDNCSKRWYVFSYMILLRILSALVGGAIVLGFVLLVFALLWWIILPVVLFGAGLLLLAWALKW
jgi:hypothetical protein